MSLPTPGLLQVRAALPRFWSHLGSKMRWRAAMLLVLLVINSAIELVSIGAVVPATALIVNPQSMPTFLGETFGRTAAAIFGDTDMVTLAMLTLAFLFTLKFCFQYLVVSQISDFARRIKIELTQQLYATYLGQPILFHRQRHSADLVSSVHDEMHDTALALASMVNLLAELLVVISIMILLLLLAPWAGLAAAASMAIIGAAVLLWNQSALTQHGKVYREHQASKLRWLQQSFGGVKAMAIAGRELATLDRFAACHSGSANARAKLDVLDAVPRLWLELLMVFGMAAIVLAMQQSGESAAAAIPALALFAATGFRLLPSINRIVAIVQYVSFTAPSMHHTARELDIPIPLKPDAVDAPLPFFQNQLSIRGVSFAFPGTETPTLSALDMSIPFGATIGLIGASGCGKTTAIDIIAGLLQPEHGIVEVDGRNIRSDLPSWYRQIGYAPQETFLIDDSLRRNIALGLPDHDIDQAAVLRALNQAQLSALVEGWPAGIDTFIGENGDKLSGGQRQRVGIARALYANPRLLILDEPTSALDDAAEAGIAATVDALQGQVTILIASHRASLLRSCDQIYLLEDGRVTLQSIALV